MSAPNLDLPPVLRAAPASKRRLGVLEAATPTQLHGWAVDLGQPGHAAELILVVDGKVIRGFRPQYLAPGLAARLQGRSGTPMLLGFVLNLPEQVRDGRMHQVEVRFARTGEVLHGSPVSLCQRQLHAQWPLAGSRLACSAPAPVRATSPPSPRALSRRAPAVVGACELGTKGPHVSVIVLNRNGAALLDALLASWQQHSRTVPVEWIVVDHASTDDSLARLKGWQTRLDADARKGERLRVVALDSNDSFSASCNRAARMARAPYLLFLNNDIVWQHDALPQMLHTLAQPDVRAVGLKLLKVRHEYGDAQVQVSAPPANRMHEVQHLGVRFMQHQGGYGPYEATPSSVNGEVEASAQDVPAVTGAALLCRKVDFDAVGGFHPDYFYGFEDVELCLRLTRRLGGRIVCRNDLTALHHHGHTRLTGREAGIIDRVARNESVLRAHAGLWLKHAWWRSLLSGDRGLCTEPLTVGLVIDPPGQRTPLNRAMWALAARLHVDLPHARIWLVAPGDARHDVRDVHVLVVADPLYDVSLLQNLRNDLRRVAWCVDLEQGEAQALALWEEQPHVHDYDLFVRPAHLTYKPSSAWLADTARWRAVVVVAGEPGANDDDDAAHDVLACAHRLVAQLRKQGHAARMVWASEWMAQPEQRPVVEVCVWCNPAPDQAPEVDCLNICWTPKVARHRMRGADWVTARMPSAQEITDRLEQRLGRAFSAP